MGTPSTVNYDFTLQSLSESAFNSKSRDEALLFTSIPAEIVGIDDYESEQCLAVKASINDIYVTRDSLKLESITIPKVFVPLPRAGGFSIKIPVAVGDPVRLCWSHRDLGEYLSGDGSAVDVNVKELAGLEDCWVMLDGGTRSNNVSPSATNFIIEGPNTKLTITPAGKITLNTEGDIAVTNDGNVTMKNTGNVALDNGGNMSVKNGGSLSVDSSGSATLKAPAYTIDAATVTVSGDILCAGSITSSVGVFAPSYAGPAGAGGSMVIGDVTADSIEVATLSVGGKLVNGHQHGGDADQPF